MYLLRQKLIAVRQNKLTTAKQNILITARQNKLMDGMFWRVCEVYWEGDGKIDIQTTKTTLIEK